MASDTRRPSRGRVRRVLGAVADHLFRIRYRLLLVNVIVVAVPIVGIGFARTFEREMLESLEADMIHQAQLLGEALLDDAGGPRLAERGPMLTRAARTTRTRIRLLDAQGRVVADSHAAGPPEGAEKPVPGYFGRGRDSYHAPEEPEPVDVADRREVRTALGGKYGSATRLWQNRERVYLFSALPITPEGSRQAREGTGNQVTNQVLGVVYVTRSTAPVKFAMYRLRTWLFVVLGAAILLTAVISLFLAATISRPLTRLTRMAERIAAGDRRRRLTLDRRDEIGKLARAFDLMTQKLDARARYTSELAANISHEFKSPLTSIRGAAELLGDGAVDDVPARDKFLANIIEDTERLDRLVTRLLLLSRFEADVTPTEYFDYEALVREVVEQKRASLGLVQAGAQTEARSPEARSIHIELVYRSQVATLCGRRSHLASVLENLMDNALQHADPATTVTVMVSDGPDHTVRTAVTNHGPVITEATLQRMWDRFFTTRAGQGGTGLGLAIVASVVEAHGGKTAVTTSAEHGTTFSFDLPRE